MRKRFPLVIGACLGLLCAFGFGSPAHAEHRVALVIGNAAYQYVPKLLNSTNDAEALATKFDEAGFKVFKVLDVGIIDFKRALREFALAAKGSDLAVVYFAGRGIMVNGINYLVPVDARLARDVDAADEAVTLERLLESVDGAKRLRLVIVDACQENPFALTMNRSQAAGTALDTGLGIAVPKGALIAFAAKPGSPAEDGQSGHSPFASALMHHLFVPGLDVGLAFRRVHDEVLQTTDQRQEPCLYGSRSGEVISLVSDGKHDLHPLK
jgi:uncharacterized caspase-like protein